MGSEYRGLHVQELFEKWIRANEHVRGTPVVESAPAYAYRELEPLFTLDRCETENASVEIERLLAECALLAVKAAYNNDHERMLLRRDKLLEWMAILEALLMEPPAMPYHLRRLLKPPRRPPGAPGGASAAEST